MKALHLLLIILIATGCKLTKEERRMNRATKKLERLVTKFPELKRTDTTFYPVEVVTERVQFDTTLLVTTDTVKIEKDNLRVKWLVRNDTMWFEAMCDTIVVRDTVRVVTDTIQPVKHSVRVDREIPWWVYAVIGVLVVMVVGLIWRR